MTRSFWVDNTSHFRFWFCLSCLSKQTKNRLQFNVSHSMATAWSSLQTLLLHSLIQCFIIAMLKPNSIIDFFATVVLIHRHCSGTVLYAGLQYNGIDGSRGWADWLCLAVCLCVRASVRASVGVSVRCLSGICQGVCQCIYQIICQGMLGIGQSISWSVCCPTVRVSVETSLGASVRASVKVSVEPSVRVSLDLNCIMYTVILSS